MSKQLFHRFVINGAPGSGKGTISSWITRDFPLKYTAAGDLLRNQISAKTADGIKASQFITKGSLVPDELVTKLVLNELTNFDGHHWLLDGFPRTLVQAISLDSQIKLTKLIDINVPHEEIINRVKGRLIHQKSGRVYNTHFNPPKVANKDDITGEDLIQREDDKPEVVRARLESYKTLVEPILHHYKEKGLLVQFSGSTSHQIYAKVNLFLHEYHF